MSIIKLNFVLLFFSICITLNVCGQTTRTKAENVNSWFMYFGNHKISKRFGVHAEIQLRRHNVVADNQQLLLRTGIDYYTPNNNRFTLGYAFVETFPYGDFAVPEAFPEHRIWQQFTTTQAFDRLKLAHRYRLEERWIGNSTTGEFKNGRYETRARYMAKLTYNITNTDKPIFASIYDEIFVNFGKEVGYNIFDQNRLYGAIGFSLSKSTKLEVGYLYQVVQLRSLDLTGTPKNKIENNHTLQLGLFSTLPFYSSETK